jgi:hypothetical protein
MVCTDKLPYIVAGFDNLKTAVDPLSEEDERVLLMSLLGELNNLFPVNLSTDVVCDSYTDNTNDVFSDETMDRTDLVLIGASHLSKIRRHFDSDYWRVTDLTRPGWRISADSVAELVDGIATSHPLWSGTPPQSYYSCSITACSWSAVRKERSGCPAKTAQARTTSMVT